MEIKSAVQMVCEVVKSFYPPRANGKTIVAESLNTIIKYVNEKEESAEKYKWHDLRKNPLDLPETNKEVLVETCDKHQRVAWIYKCYWAYAGGNLGNTVIAWRYIGPFEEEE